MKRTVLSLFLILVSIAAIIQATRAYFTSTEKVLSNSVATGVLNYHIQAKSDGKPWNLSDLRPGYNSGWESLTMTSSSLPLKPYFYLDDQTGDSDLYNALEIDLYDSGTADDCSDPLTGGVLYYSGPVSAITGEGSKRLVNDDPTWGSAAGSHMPANQTQILCQRIRFPASQSDQNNLQGKSVGFTEYLYATEYNP